MNRPEAMAYMNGSGRVALAIFLSDQVGDAIDDLDVAWQVVIGAPAWVLIMALVFWPLRRVPR